MSAPQVAVVGGGMITNDQILPSLYHLQCQGVIGEIAADLALDGETAHDIEMFRIDRFGGENDS